MDKLQIFNFEGKEIRTAIINGEPWFVGKDIAKSLEYAWHRGLFNHVPDEWKGVNPFDTPGGTQEMQCLTEQGLYFFLGRSDKEKALPFQKWIAGDVLPSIRKHGAYMTEATMEKIIADPDFGITLLQALKDEKAKSETLEIALNQSLQFYTVAKYNKTFKMGWSLKKCQNIGKKLTAYCMARAIEIRTCQTNDERFGVVNIYPLTAWEGLFPLSA
ncbi:MAG: hypothetical protein FWG63_05050 [Defluviitaleaceae bacterium]|nr:hypothetical protein [Defluviitaleaceae bacterium]